MKINKQLLQFVKFALITSIANIIVSLTIFIIAYPIISDTRLFIALLIIVPIAFALLFSMYIIIIQRWIVQYIFKLNEPGIAERLKTNFKRTTVVTFYLNWIFILMVFVPFVSIAFLFLGYDNVYYHFYILFICYFLNMYFGYYSTNVWYSRTYPLGRFGIPITIQPLRNKIVSLILPIVVFVTVLISIIVYFSFNGIVKEQINETIRYQIKIISDTVEKYDDASSAPWLDMMQGRKGGIFLINGDGILIYSNSGQDIGKKITEIIQKGDQAEYLYNNTINHLSNISHHDDEQFDGVCQGKFSVFFTKKITTGDTVIMALFEKDLYEKFYFTMFLVTIGLVILTIVLWFVANRRLVTISRTMDSFIPSITRAAKGDLSEKIVMVKTRDILEEFTRVFIKFIEIIREFVGKSRDLSTMLLDLSRSIEEMGAYIRDVSHEHVEVLKDSTTLIQGFSSSFSSIAERSGEQKELIQNFENAINFLNESMLAVSKSTGDVIISMKNMEGSANRGGSLVENTISGMQNIEKFYESILNVIQLISDIADQVNLLSLNASIEAARAGEHGKGFAVVAEEISKLADRTGSSVKEITSLINKGDQEVKKGKNMVLDMKNSFGGIMKSINDTSSVVNGFVNSIQQRISDIVSLKNDIKNISDFSRNLSESTNKQIQNAFHVSDIITKVNTGVQDFAEKSGKLYILSEQLQQMTVSLNETLAKFKLE